MHYLLVRPIKRPCPQCKLSAFLFTLKHVPAGWRERIIGEPYTAQPQIDFNIPDWEQLRPLKMYAPSYIHVYHHWKSVRPSEMRVATGNLQPLCMCATSGNLSDHLKCVCPSAIHLTIRNLFDHCTLVQPSYVCNHR